MKFTMPDAAFASVVSLFEKISGYAPLKAVRSGFVMTFPLMLVGAIAVLVNQFPWPAYQEAMTALFGEGWRALGVALWNGTLAIMSLVLSFSVAQHLAEHHNEKTPRRQVEPAMAGLVSLSALCTLIVPVSSNIPQAWTSVSGLFVAVVSALLSSRLFLFLSSLRSWRSYSVTRSSDRVIIQAFDALLPAGAVVLLAALVGVFVEAIWHTSVHMAIHNLIAQSFSVMGEGPVLGFVYTLVLQIFWFFGIHGANVLDPITHGIFEEAIADNGLAFSLGLSLPHVITKPFLDCYVSIGGAGSTISLIIALLIGRSTERRKLALIALVLGLFNINEPLVFGLPIIFNPIMLIPFILTPLVLGSIAYLAIDLGIAPGTSAAIGWNVPIFVNSYLASGSIGGPILQAVNILIGVAIYMPFVRLSEHIQKNEFSVTFSRLCQRAYSDVQLTMGPRCINVPDETGTLARGMVGDLSHALDVGAGKSGIYLEYQPQVAPLAGAVVGVEALLRWHHPRIGPIPAPLTAVLAEDGALIKSLGAWIINEACRTRRKWLDAGVTDVTMSVNISPRQIDKALPDTVRNALIRHQLSPHDLELEIIESSALQSGMDSTDVLKAIHELGVPLAIDDFGMGHTTLKYLKEFPVNSVKIDGAIIREVTSSALCADIVNTIVSLCQARNILCVAEFVENEEQVKALLDLKCGIFQGYYYSRPLKDNVCLDFIKNFDLAKHVEMKRAALAATAAATAASDLNALAQTLKA